MEKMTYRVIRVIRVTTRVRILVFKFILNPNLMLESVSASLITLDSII